MTEVSFLSRMRRILCNCPEDTLSPGFKRSGTKPEGCFVMLLSGTGVRGISYDNYRISGAVY